MQKSNDRVVPVKTPNNVLRMQKLAALFAIIFPAYAFSSGSVHWSYSGGDGPQNWGGLSSDYGLCASGMNQSPINISNSTSSNLFELEFNYGSVPLQIVNNGHTIQANYNTTVLTEENTIELEGEVYTLPSATSYNSSISISGEEYSLLQFHFHSPSEHLDSGQKYPLEAHFVHANSAGQLAVVGVFFRQGENNRLLSKVWSNMPQSADGVHVINSVQINVEDLLPEDRDYYHYRGSLTTPPCSEGVRWFVMQDSVEASSSQISKFLSVIGENARPTQPVNSRFLLDSQ